MPLARFLRQLSDHGRVRVPLLEASDPSDARGFAAASIGALHQALAEVDAVARSELANTAPPLDLPAARWATVVAYRACQFVISRDVDAAAVRQALAVDLHALEDLGASRIYSVDLTLRFLPDIVALAGARSAGDSMLDSLRELALAWPLSSVGIENLEGLFSLEPILADRCLSALYLDRIIERDDPSRLTPEILGRLDPLLVDRPQLAGPRVARFIEAEAA